MRLHYNERKACICCHWKRTSRNKYNINRHYMIWHRESHAFIGYLFFWRGFDTMDEWDDGRWIMGDEWWTMYVRCDGRWSCDGRVMGQVQGHRSYSHPKSARHPINGGNCWEPCKCWSAARISCGRVYCYWNEQHYQHERSELFVSKRNKWQIYLVVYSVHV